MLINSKKGGSRSHYGSTLSHIVPGPGIAQPCIPNTCVERSSVALISVPRKRSGSQMGPHWSTHHLMLLLTLISSLLVAPSHCSLLRPTSETQHDKRQVSQPLSTILPFTVPLDGSECQDIKELPSSRAFPFYRGVFGEVGDFTLPSPKPT